MTNIEHRIKNIHRMYKQGDHEGALHAINRMIFEHPYDDRVFHMRAFLLQIREEYQKAAVDLDRAIELNPNEPNNFYSSAFVQLTLGNWGRVVSDCTRGLSLGSDYHATSFPFVRAEALILLGRKAEARADLDRLDDGLRMWTTALRTKEDLLLLCL